MVNITQTFINKYASASVDWGFAHGPLRAPDPLPPFAHSQHAIAGGGVGVGVKGLSP